MIDLVNWAQREPRVSVLIVDDRKEDLLALQQVLASDSYDLVACSSGEQALREVLTRDFAVILLDVHMPIMDGFETAAIIKQRDRSRSTPILFLTAGNHDVSYIYRAYSVGAVDYLSKPIDGDVVKAKVAIFAELFRKEERIRLQSEALREADRREREARLTELRRASERRYRNLAEAIPEIVWTARADGAAEYFNRRWREYTGMSPREAAGAGWLAAVHGEDVPRYEERFAAASASGEAVELELRLRAKDGSYRWYVSRAVPERGRRNKIVGWLGTHSDIDDVKRAHESAKEAIRLRDEFLSIASHELRTPLATLSLQLDGLLRLLGQENGNGAPSRELAKARGARKQATRLEKLIGDLLDVSRITGGRLALEPEEVDLDALVRDVVDRLGDDLERAGSRIDLASKGPIVGRWDRLRLEQVVTNLLANAVKYGLGKPIRVSVEQDADRVQVSVQDFGIGISCEDQSRIFDRFERAASLHHYGGFGLGLWITQQIIDAMDGRIRVESEPNHGSTFTVELPIRARSGVSAASEPLDRVASGGVTD